MAEFKPLHILMVAGSFPALSETFIYRKACSLAERGHRVTVCTRKPGHWEPFRATPLPARVKVVVLPPDGGFAHPSRAARAASATLAACFTCPASASRLWKRCRTTKQGSAEQVRLFIRHALFLRMRCDVLHFEFSGLPQMYPFVPELMGSLWVMSCRGADIHLLDQKPVEDRQRIIESLRKASAVHCVSEEMAACVRKHAGEEVSTFVNRPAVAVPEKPISRSTENASPKIIAVGRLVWKKGLDYLLAALAKLNDRGIPFTCEIIGDGDLRASFEFSVHDLGLGERVRLLGALTPQEVAARMAEADIFVLSSHEEGISNAALEAMSFAKPVVTTNAGGMAEAVRDGVDGFVVPVRDVMAMAESIERLLANPELRQRMGCAGRARVEQEFTLDRQVAVFETVYRKLIEEAGR